MAELRFNDWLKRGRGMKEGRGEGNLFNCGLGGGRHVHRARNVEYRTFPLAPE